MAKLKYLIIHCTSTPEGRAVSSDNIRQWHIGPAQVTGGLKYKGKIFPALADLPKETIGGIAINKLLGGRGWNQVGYSDMIHLSGVIENLVPYDGDDDVESWELTNGVASINKEARHIVYVGGLTKSGLQPKDTRTTEQRLALANYIRQTIAQHPSILVAGHNQFDPKACPSFDTRAMLKANGISPANIYAAPLKFKFA